METTTTERFTCRVPDCNARNATPAPATAAGKPEGNHAPPLCAACWGKLDRAEQRMYADGDLSDDGIITAVSFRRALGAIGFRGRAKR